MFLQVHTCLYRFMASEPDKWDYGLAGVPSPLTDEMESQQMAKQVGCLPIQDCTPSRPDWTRGHHKTAIYCCVVAYCLSQLCLDSVNVCCYSHECNSLLTVHAFSRAS